MRWSLEKWCMWDRALSRGTLWYNNTSLHKSYIVHLSQGVRLEPAVPFLRWAEVLWVPAHETVRI